MADSITCPRCGKTSHHLMDITERYCGHCHAYHDTMRSKPVLIERVSETITSITVEKVEKAHP